MENNIFGIWFILFGIYHYLHPKTVLYGVQINWSYMSFHIVMALIFISLGVFIIYRENFSDYSKKSKYRSYKLQPLKYVDPSGHWGFSSFFKSVAYFVKRHIKTIVTIAVTVTRSIFPQGGTHT